MKIAYFAIIVLLMIMKTSICLQAKIDHSLYISPNPQINFFEMHSQTQTHSSMTTVATGGLKYKSHFVVHKQIDTVHDKPVEFDADIELATTSLKVFLDGRLKKEISYLEYRIY